MHGRSVATKASFLRSLTTAFNVEGERVMKRRSAFTLIELLVVIAIIAILAAILFPVFAKARSSARRTTCLSNTKQMTTGMLMYVQDFDEQFPSWNWGFFCNGGNNGRGRDSSAFWTMAIYPYVKNAGVYRCLEDPFQWNDAWASCSDDAGKKDLFGPYRPDGSLCEFWQGCNQNYVSYGLNEALTGGFPTNRLAVIQTPANWMMLADSASQLADIWVWNRPDDGNKNIIPSRIAWASQPEGCCMMWDCCHDSSYWNQNYTQKVLEAATRHNGGENISFVDGHSKFLKWSALTWKNLSVGDS
jgi:prepilin-type N-terminal cleavage/methylation domain-containing protein/prepilin-type processing-associated H-X9-DG protein